MAKLPMKSVRSSCDIYSKIYSIGNHACCDKNLALYKGEFIVRISMSRAQICGQIHLYLIVLVIVFVCDV